MTDKTDTPIRDQLAAVLCDPSGIVVCSGSDGDRLEIAIGLAKVGQLERELAALREELASVLTDWNALVKASGSPTNGGAVGHVAALKTELAALREKQQGEWNAAIDAAISGARECLLCDADVRWDNNTPQVGDGTAANRAVEYVIKAIRALKKGQP
jgi:hypothetical protein